MPELKNYLTILDGERRFYGGSQLLSEDRTIRKCGCGLVAAADMLIYISCPEGKTPEICLRQYGAFLKSLLGRYFHLVPPFGMTPLALAAGLDKYFRENRLGYRAVPAASKALMWQRTEEMLKNGLPVILAIGGNLPFPWQKHRLALYERKDKGTYSPAFRAKAHFVSVTGLDESWLKVSSWGKLLYISRREFEKYVSEHSSGIISNVIYIKKLPDR